MNRRRLSDSQARASICGGRFLCWSGAVLMIALALFPLMASVSEWRVPDAGFPWSFPKDHWAHRDFRIEWWYVTGHLATEAGKTPRFGYQFTIFRIGLSPRIAGTQSNWSSGQLLMAHGALSDLQEGTHHFAELLYREHPDLAEFGDSLQNPIAWAIGVPGTAGRWNLAWEDSGFVFSADAGGDFGFDLRTRPMTPPVLQGPGGLSRKSGDSGAASLYYSFPRMETGGTVRESGQQYEVTGESWMDKEFSSAFLSDQQTGWDWFSLRLEDGRSLMLYQLRRESGSIDFRGGTVIGPGSAVRYLEEDGWTAQPDDWWTSPTTAGRYPISWKVQVPTLELDLRVEADFPNQENVSRLIPSLAYWEGSVKIHQDGRLAGRGYLELTGYVPGGRLPLQAGGD